MENPKKLFLLDAYALIYRAYFAFIKNPRINSKGQNTSAIFGFVNTLEDLIKRENPSHIAVGFDPSGPTFRHDAYDKYKAQREETPEDIRKSVPYIKKIIAGYNIPILEVPGFEADDVIGTMAWKAEKAGFTVYMMTPDKDYGQLVTDKVFMYRPKYGSNECEVFGPEEVKIKYGLTDTKQMIDFLGLMGDSSDNIPGCPGVGEVTAKKLIAEFGSIDNLLEKADQIKGKLKDKIIENKEQILFSKFLATIRTDVPIDFVEEQLVREAVNEDVLAELFDELEFRNMLNRIKSSPAAISKEPQKEPAKKNAKKPTEHHGQISLWDIVEEKEELVTENTLFKDDESGLFSTKGSDEKNHSNLRTLETVPHSYYLLDTEEKINDFLQEIAAQKFFSLDTETTGLDAMTAELVGMSFSWKKSEAYYLPFPSDQKECKKKLQHLKTILENPLVEKIGQNIKYDIHICGPIFDTMIAHYLLQPELRHNMDYLAEIYLNYQTVHIEELIGPKGKNQKNMRELSAEAICPYAAEDADITLQLKTILEPEIKNNNLVFLCYEVEMPLVLVLADMENTGVNIDRATLKQASIDLTEKMNQLERDIQDMAGEEFNVNSPKQIGEILFEKMEIGGKAKKTKTGQYSTAEDVLESLKSKHPIVEKILEQRGLKKLLSTYIDALPELINPTTGKVHTSFNQAVTATGRLSSSNPNLQNIPIREELGREIRRAFSAADGSIFLSADYSQIELRLMAHLSQDPSMIEAFNMGQDIHSATAAKVYKIPLEEVTSDMRRKAKTANFGIIYGISVFGLAERMNVPRAEAKDLIDGYFETYPNVKAYMDHSINEAKNNGWVETIYHRKRFLPDINSGNGNVRGYAERNAINAPIQGTAADIIKLAMVNIQKAIEANQLKSKMILQVHDELNFIVPESELEQLQAIVSWEMENAVKLDVPLRADVGSGKNWLEAH